MPKAVRILLIGAPGSGKGTQGRKLAQRYGVAELAVGDLLREAVRQGTNLGLKAKNYMDSGNLVPNDVVIELVCERLNSSDCSNGFILDGFPRTIEQAHAMDDHLIEIGKKLLFAISFDVVETELIKRLAGRRQCNKCGLGYHVEFRRPKKDNVCDECGTALSQREDDKEETVRERLRVYSRQTEPLLEHYAKVGLLKRISGSGSIDKVFKEICSLIDK